MNFSWPFGAKKQPSQPAPLSLEEEIFAASQRFEKLGSDASLEKAEVAFLEHFKAADAHAQDALVSDFAAWLGEAFRESHQGQWIDNDLFGPVVLCDGRPTTLFVPLAVSEKKAELGDQLSISRFFETIPDRLSEAPKSFDSETLTEASLATILDDFRASNSSEAMTLAQERAQQFRDSWKARFGRPITLSLNGVREAERFLRSQFFLCSVDSDFVVDLGFFLGEVARGLYQGEWNFEVAKKAHDISKVALEWPELPYYPLGRVLQLMTIRPEDETLDEYVRLVPSARSELRKLERDRSALPQEE